MKHLPLLALSPALMVSSALCRDFRPAVTLEELTAADSSVQQCCLFQTTPGVRYTV